MATKSEDLGDDQLRLYFAKTQEAAEHFRQALANTDLGVADKLVLAALVNDVVLYPSLLDVNDERPVTATDLSRRTALARQTVNRSVNNLADPSDGGPWITAEVRHRRTWIKVLRPPMAAVDATKEA